MELVGWLELVKLYCTLQGVCEGQQFKLFVWEHILKFTLAPVQPLSILLIKNHAMKAYGEQRHQTEMSGQLHALAAISPGEKALVFGPEDGGSKHLHNIRNYLSHLTAGAIQFYCSVYAT
jgi:hypothetical protein